MMLRELRYDDNTGVFALVVHLYLIFRAVLSLDSRISKRVFGSACINGINLDAS